MAEEVNVTMAYGKKKKIIKNITMTLVKYMSQICYSFHDNVNINRCLRGFMLLPKEFFFP